MALKEVSVTHAVKVINVSRLSVFLLFIMGIMMYMLTQVTNLFQSLVFYSIFMLFVWQYSSTLSQLQNKRRFLLSVVDYDITEAFPAMFIWGFCIFLLFGFFYNTVGTSIAFPSIDVFINQLFVASSETFIFCIFLPEAVGEYYGRIPFTKRKIPGWVWGAGIFFGTFHIFTYSKMASGMTLLMQVMIAIFMGLVFYALYKYRERNKNVGGAAASICLHWNWNVWAITTAQILMFVL